MCVQDTGWTGGLNTRTVTHGELMILFYLALIALCRHAVGSPDGDGYSLSTAEVYLAYTSDLEVTYTIPTGVSMPNAFLQLFSLDYNREITTLGVTLGMTSQTLRIACGVVEYAGDYAFRMFMYLGGRKLAETRLKVKWPTISLSLPPEHVALTGGFPLTMTSEAKCNAIVHRYTFWIELIYLGPDRDGASRGLYEPYQMGRKNVSAINKPRISEFFDCSSTDIVGFYRAELKSNSNSSVTIAQSNLMFVTWSDKYNLATFYNSVFPCDKNLTLMYEQPLCTDKMDKIRMYKLVRKVQGSLAAPIEQVYVMERFAVRAGRTLTFNCSTFERQALGYCFIYVSLSRTGAVAEQKKYCLPAHENAADGHWSAWSPWGQCSVSCGNGKKSRFRMCDNPPPMNGGDFCVGDPVEWTPCSSVCPELLSELTPLYSVKLDERCACGCTMTNSTGKLVASGRCQGLAIWRIRVKRDQKIKLSFAYMDLYENMQWVQVRNGGSRHADLLAFSDGSVHLDDVTSSTNEMLVEFMTKSTSASTTSLGIVLLEPTKSIHVHGFIAYYNVLNNNVTTVAASRLTPITKPVWENAVTIVGVVVCVLIIIGTVLFVVYHRIQRKNRHKYKMTKTESPTSPVHNKGTSIQTPSSPDELDSPGVDMETPLTGELKRKDYPVNAGKSRGSSISSTSSAGYRRLRAMADVETGGSSRPSSRPYTPLQSPYAANASIEDFKHDQNFFKGYRPRSPKVHPSPKMRRSSNSKSPTSPPTKHSMLTKALVERRKDEDDNRVVTGASSTPTSKDQSGSASTSKTEDRGPDTSKRKKREKTPGGGEAHSDKFRSDKPTGSKESRRTEKPRDGKDSHSKSKSSRKKLKSSGVLTPMKNTVEMDVKSVTPRETSAQHTTTEFTGTQPKARRPTSLTDSYDSDKPAAKASSAEKKKFKFIKKREAPKTERNSPRGAEERQKCLPRPDGQSPESIMEERVTPSVNSTPKSIKSLRSNKTLSPTKSVRSANTPSDMAELEYDDFIEDDPLSYFEYNEMLKLRWHGVEKIGKPVKEESAVNGVEKH
ncbi:uncharacterized protein LOC135472859 isoform X2 [Liolophura sinensis]|uniref:uncharacterized protein LOC135472859 isoform X2 n=1 Tax=Liolophura sinensis TaxID=3198878 RepID=UPI0031598814